MKIVFTVTTDLTYDQRMIRICNSLSGAGHTVLLIGRKQKKSIPLQSLPYQQHRINCLFEKGKLFYLEYNIRLFFYLLTKKMDCIGAIDLDTILPCYYISRIKKIKRVYDAHELFCEMKEIVERPFIYKIWKWIERKTVPHFSWGYTVNRPIADEFYKMYGLQYEIIRNIALLRPLTLTPKINRYILYQGAVNEGRCFETLIPAMKQVDAVLYICGDGNFMEQAKALVTLHALEKKVIFKGKVPPDELRLITKDAYIGITLFDDKGLSNYYSLANRFFDYLHAGIPQLCVDYPVYRELNERKPIASLISDTSSNSIALALNNLLQNEVVYNQMQKNCMEQREIYNWQIEQEKLINFYTELEKNIV